MSLGAKGPLQNLCESCWTLETRSSNNRLISALNEMTRRIEARSEATGADANASEAMAAGSGDGSAEAADPVREGRRDPRPVALAPLVH